MHLSMSLQFSASLRPTIPTVRFGLRIPSYITILITMIRGTGGVHSSQFITFGRLVCAIHIALHCIWSLALCIDHHHHSRNMMLVTGDETGLVKLVKSSDDIVKTFGEQDRQRAVAGFAAINQYQFSLVRKNGDLEYWEHSIEEDDHDLLYLRTINLENIQATGICGLFDSTPRDSSSALVYDAEGNLVIVQHNGTDKIQVPVTVKGPISAVASCSQGGVALGGKENDLSLFDSNTQQITWTAKNVPYDKLRLRVPIWVSAISFFSPEQASLSTGVKLLTGTGYKQVRLYDTRTDSRPVKSFEIGEYRVTQLVALPDEQNVYVSDTIGNVFHYDLRTGRRLHALTASDGAVRHMTCYENSDVMVCVGLDRHARWHNLSTHKPLKSVYLRNRLNACLPLGGAHIRRGGVKRSRNSDSDGEESEEESDGEAEGDMEDVDAFLGSGDEEADSELEEFDDDNDEEDEGDNDENDDADDDEEDESDDGEDDDEGEGDEK